MAEKMRFELDSKGVRELLQSDAMLDICSGYASRAVASLGDGYEVNTYHGRTRVNAEVEAVTAAAKKENLENNTILKAVMQ